MANNQNNSDYDPVYGLQGSREETSSSPNDSPPRNLIKLFIQNRNSLSSSGQMSSSISMTSQSQESSEDAASGAGYQCVSPTRSSKGFASYSALASSNEMHETNNNQAFNKGVMDSDELGRHIDNDLDEFEDSLIVEDVDSLILPKVCPNRQQVSTIKEEDEALLSDSSRADVLMTSASEDQPCLVSFGSLARTARAAPQQQLFAARRSTSMDRFLTQPRSAVSSTAYGQNAQPVIFPSRRFSAGSSTLNYGAPVKDPRLEQNFYSASSGMRSTTSRPASHDWLRRTHALSSPMGYKSSLNAHNSPSTRTTSTQVPVYIQDKEVQTQTSAADSHTQFYVKENSKLRCNVNMQVPLTTRDEKRAFYFCYPNSLPDLSFLSGLQSEKERDSSAQQSTNFSPTKVGSTVLRPKSTAATGNRGRTATRPKSFGTLNDFETFRHIKDPESLNVLLPNEFKRVNEMSGDDMEEEEKESKLQSQAQCSQMRQDDGERRTANNGVKMRFMHSRMGRDGREQSLDSHFDKHGTGSVAGSCGCSSRGSKRYSLQEPYGGDVEFGAMRSPETQYKCMTRSETMPVYHPLPCQWPPAMYNCAQPAPCVHGCCHQVQQMHHPVHSCCRSPCYSMPSTPNISSRHLARKDPAIDQLCELLSMDNTLTEVTNLLNGTASQLKSPSQPLADLHENNFRVLKNHWEALAESLDQKSQTASGLTNANSLRQSASSTSTRTSIERPACEARTKVKPQVATKPAAVVMRRPRNGEARAKGRPVSLNSPFKSMIPTRIQGTKTPPGPKQTAERSTLWWDSYEGI